MYRSIGSFLFVCFELDSDIRYPIPNTICGPHHSLRLTPVNAILEVVRSVRCGGSMVDGRDVDRPTMVYIRKMMLIDIYKIKEQL